MKAEELPLSNELSAKPRDSTNNLTVTPIRACLVTAVLAHDRNRMQA
jgi:hypothetical protein